MSYVNRLKRALRSALLLSSLLLSLPALGDVTYTLHLGSSAEELQVSNSVVTAAALYNQFGSFNKHWDVYYNAGIPTAEANYNGYMGFGSQRTTRTVLHEGAHTLGMGTGPNYNALIAGGVWAGQNGNQAQFDTYNDYVDGLHGDGHAIWPGGFNYESEDGFIERVWMVRIQAAIRCDIGIMAYNKEARNELVHPGDTTEFHVESPAASAYRWYKGGGALTNGGDISGADTATLRIANAEAADEGSYHCAATGAGETLNSRPRQLWVRPMQQLGQWNLDGNAADSANTNHGTAYGSPVYVAGKFGQAIDLDGVDDYVQLPAGIGMAKDITVATWVNWDGGNNWQRIFDFGTGTYQNMFLTPKSGSGTLRLAFKDSINGVDSEKQINTTVLPTGQWVHLAAVLNGDYATLYVNGQAVGSVFDVGMHPTDFLPTLNYIGKSQYADPLFNGRIDDFRIYNHALSGAEVWNLWGQSANAAPVFTANPIAFPDVVRDTAYTGQTLASYASDNNGDVLSYFKLDGPAWLSVATDGSVSGTPGAGDHGLNTAIVRVLDPAGASSDAVVQINVLPKPSDGGLVHRYGFNEAGGSIAADSIGGADGGLAGGTSLGGGQLSLDGGSTSVVNLPASNIAINEFSGLTIEAWATPASALNTGFNTLIGFGKLNASASGLAGNYLILQTHRGDNNSRVAISLSDDGDPWTEEDWVNGPELNDNHEHHYAAVVTATNIAYYVDNVLQNTSPLAISGNNALSGIATGFAQIGDAYPNDPNWGGTVNELRLYNRALTADEIALADLLGPDQLLNGGSPELHIATAGSNLILSWPIAYAGFSLQSKPDLLSGDWLSVGSPAPQIVDDEWQVVLPFTNDSTIYRLAK